MKLMPRRLLFVALLLVLLGVAVRFVVPEELFWKTYTHPRLHYSIRIPGNWQVDDTRTNYPTYDRMVSPKEEIIATVSVYQDVNAATQAGFNQFAEEIRRSYTQNPEMTLLYLNPQYHWDSKIRGEYVSAGTWKKPGGLTYEQTETARVNADGYIYILTINIDQKLGGKYAKFPQKVFMSFVPPT